MLLKGFEVFNFRSIIDSSWIETENITSFVGTNESGKTNILLPLWKLNPVRDGNIDCLADMPRNKYSQMILNPSEHVFIKVKYELTDSEKESLSSLVSGEPKESFKEIIVSKNYNNDFGFEFPEQKYEDQSMQNINTIISELKNQPYYSKIKSEFPEFLKCTDDSGEYEVPEYVEFLISDIKKSQTSIVNSIDNEVNLNNSFENLITNLSEISQIYKMHILKDNESVKDWIIKNIPQYVYYSNYGNLDSQILFSQIKPLLKQGKITDPKIRAKVRTLKTLFEFLHLDVDEIEELGKEKTSSKIQHEKDERFALLESASTDLSNRFREWWKQGNYTFNLLADGDYFKITVSDDLRPEKINLEARSTGLQWFFSFFLVFLNESERENKNSILLLDEPGVTLHPTAQKDLFEFFNNLSLKNQLLYTTHSPFMVDSNNLETVRSVYVNNKGESVVSSNLRASEREYGIDQTKSIFSVHAALGLTVSDTLLINCNPILVEGPSDQIYFSVLKNLMVQKAYIHPIKDIIFIPTGGVKGIQQTSTIVSAKSNDYPYVILDGDNSGRDKKKSLEKGLYSGNQEKLIDLTLYTHKNGEVEDLFPKKQLAVIANNLFFRKEDLEEDFDDLIKNEKPFVNQIEEFANRNLVKLPEHNEWKIKLAEEVKKIIIKGKKDIFEEGDKELNNIKVLFQKIVE